MQLDGATVHLYDSSIITYDPNNPATFDTVTFAPQLFSGPNDGMEIKNIGGLNAVVGIDTEPLEFLAFVIDNAGVYNNGEGGPFWIWTQRGAVDPVFGQTGFFCGEGDFTFNCLTPNGQSNPAPLVLTTTYTDPPNTGRSVTVSESVPEPGTMALLLGGLGAGWFARRRKSTA